ncbi:DUF6098 family protein [Cellulosimicrobium cellulans]|uniref:DUF6098 family protein n=1 Tax=Cellulosimicrobium cellulans TaxID=1710 RepID=UPI001F050C1C|nr:DUF6098 family protein [Cellulosimicrobium cellulans]
MPERTSALDALPRLRSLAEVAELVAVVHPLYVRFSGGPDQDSSTVSRDHESGCLLPGLSVNPMNPEPWWDRPVEHWVARQLCQYAHLMTPERFPWLLTGEVAGRGPDCEPLLVDVVPAASVDPRVVDEAGRLYREVFDAGDDGT